MNAFSSSLFHHQVDKALAAVQRILDTTRSPQYASEEDHSYEDKYEMAVLLTNMSIAALINVLERLGMTQAHLMEMIDLVHAKKSTVSLRFDLQHDCNFLEKKVVEVHSDEVVSKLKSETSEKVLTHKVVKKVDEFHWEATFTCKILIYSGVEPDDSSLYLQTHTGSTKFVTRTRNTPTFTSGTAGSSPDVNLTWLIQQLENGKCCFSIDRSDSNCKTPRRNKDVEKAQEFWDAIVAWTSASSKRFTDLIEQEIRNRHNPVVADDAPNETPSLLSVSAENIFVPVLPLMEASATRKEEVIKNVGFVEPRDVSSPDSPLLSLADVTKFLNEQCRSLDEAAGTLTKSFGDETRQFVTVADAKMVLFMAHIGNIQSLWYNGVGYIEEMLRDQLVAAIGKEVQASDFDQFITHHYHKMFAQQYAPRPFCYAIRRPNHYPDGILSIENVIGGMDPIQTMVRVFSDIPMMQIPINAATTIDMDGPVYLHGWLSHRFATCGSREFKLVGRARQFSSFMLMVGNMAGGDRFHPKDAIMLQNKDEVTIPLLLNDLPSAKEFKDSISSLSPEQKRFAISFRAMQLESSMLGICIVQLKPQLEVLLGLPEGALTKEIKLTQDLMSLFVEYQIPSDLLTYDGPEAAAIREKVESVKENVKAVLDVIEATRTKELEEAKQKSLMNKRSQDHSSSEEVVFGMSYYQNKVMHETGAPRARAARSMASDRGAKRSGLPFKSHPTTAKTLCTATADVSTDEIGDWQEELLPVDQDTFPIEDTGGNLASNAVDVTTMPKKLNQVLEQYDDDSAVRTATIKTGDAWKRKRQENILTKLLESNLTEDDRRIEKNKAFDLLDAVSRSGSLPLLAAELHVIMGVTHCFEDSVMETVIQKNMNPIEKMERSALIVAATIHNVGVPVLVTGSEYSLRLGGELPALTGE